MHTRGHDRVHIVESSRSRDIQQKNILISLQRAIALVYDSQFLRLLRATGYGQTVYATVLC